MRDRQPECLEIWPLTGPTPMIDYRYFQYLSCNGDYGTELVVFFTFMAVKISGRLLMPGIAAIRDKRCASIHCFDLEAHARPNPDAALIETIEFLKRKE